MNTTQRIANWLESRWVTPAYSGWLLSGLALFFFIAATNTLSGWLYVLSGIGIALLAIAAILPERTLRKIRVQRVPIYPVSVGDLLTIELVLENPTAQPKTLLHIRDNLPHLLLEPLKSEVGIKNLEQLGTCAIETIAPKSRYTWKYNLPTQRRGVYRWQTVQLRTAAPLGLFWCRRSKPAKATAVVYPTVLPLTQCPLVDQMGRETRLQLNNDRRAQAATEGLTRSLRPYRWGDPTRLVHWRTSARYGELRVRELEVFTGGQELIICLDSAQVWQNSSNRDTTFPEDFEQAVIAAASLYFYACDANLSVKLWTAGTGLIQGNSIVLETLAATRSGETVYAESLPSGPIVWLTQNPLSLSTLPPGSRWLLWTGNHASNYWQADAQAALVEHHFPGRVIHHEQPLQVQLQAGLGSV